MGTFVIANDIVCVHSFSKSKAYLLKIADETEVLKLKNLDSSHNTAAILFSIKEAAYKAMIKKDLNKSFAPKKYKVEKLSVSNFEGRLLLSGCLVYEGERLWFQTQLEDAYCHTLIADDKSVFKKCDVNISENKEQTFFNESEIAHKQLLEQLKRVLNKSFNIEIVKNFKGIPYIFSNGNVIENQISISHDGKYAATVVLS